jgi:hypothetical protein
MQDLYSVATSSSSAGGSQQPSSRSFAHQTQTPVGVYHASLAKAIELADVQNFNGGGPS